LHNATLKSVCKEQGFNCSVGLFSHEHSLCTPLNPTKDAVSAGMDLKNVTFWNRFIKMFKAPSVLHDRGLDQYLQYCLARMQQSQHLNQNKLHLGA